MTWVEIVEEVAVAVVALGAAADAGRAGWVALRPPGRAVTVSAPTAGTGSRTEWVCLVTRRSAPSAARR